MPSEPERLRLDHARHAACAGRDDREKAMWAGFDAHVVKPVEPKDLLAAVVRLAQRHH